MENNFFVGKVYHVNPNGQVKSSEVLVLYNEENYFYTDLVNNKSYSSGDIAKPGEDFVDSNSLIPTNPREYNTDYNYLLMRYKENIKEKPKKKKFKFNFYQK